MSEPRDKRTADKRWFDIDCTRLLDPLETILSVAGIAADQGEMTFGVPRVNATAIAYRDGHIAAIGKVLQVEIDGGVIPAGRPWLYCYVRPLLVTTLDGTTPYNPTLDATFVIRLIDNPPV